ncbi:3-(3-hydroxy-phenyl)propionate hydroxylase [Burkholderiales bacterium]|nr:3-(3-hydroxy-phenyl)propionate hydroxylase [Burkholderiales bacterium]
MKTYQNPTYPYVRVPDQDAAPAIRPVIVVGAGPIGLALAIDLGMRGVPVVVLDDDDTVSVGSRAICYAKRSLEILDRLGCADAICARGVGWNVGKVFHRDELVYRFELVHERGHHRPGMVNLQQYHLEEALVNRAREVRGVELRWKNKVIGVRPGRDRVDVTVDTPDGPYSLSCEWLVACDGARSPVRGMLGVESEGQVFRDRFLIADIHMKSDFPPERWFWFDPPFHPGQSVLLHRQADDVWRVDFQLGWDADPDEERKSDRILPRLAAMLGPDARFDIEWASVYTFQCRRMKRFRHGRVIFAGDSAHLVSPFGARGANSGFQDTDNLAWKLALVIDGRAPEALLESYDAERTRAADENLRNSTRSTDFITPKTPVSRTFRDATLQLAKRHPFARRLVNSGRLSVPAVLADSPLNTPDRDPDFPSGPGAMVPGAPAADAPVSGAEGPWLLRYLERGFTLLAFGPLPDDAVAALARAPVPVNVVQVDAPAAPGAEAIGDTEGLVASRYAALPGTCYLLRPDQHVCARWRAFDLPAVAAACARATARN